MSDLEQHSLSEMLVTLQAIFNIIEDCVFIVNEFGQIIETNNVALDKLGYMREELYGKNILTIYDTQRRQDALTALEKMLRGEKCDYSIPLVTKQGKTIFAQTQVYKGQWKGNNVAIGIVRDMTYRKIAETRIRENEKKYSAIIKRAPGVIMIHKKGKIVFAEGNVLDEFGYKKSELIGHNLWEFVTQESKCVIDNCIEKRERGGQIDDYEMEFITKEGITIDLLVKTSAIEYEHEPAVLVVLMDITERKHAQRQVNQKEKILSAVAMSIKEFLENNDYIEAVKKSFELLGRATDVNRVYLFENYYNENGVGYTSQKIEWNSATSEPQIDNPQLQDVPHEQMMDFIAPLSQGEAYYGIVRYLKEGRTKQVLEEQNILSIVVIPIFIHECFWGFVGFDDCRTEREWSEAEIFSLRAFSNSMEKAIERNIFNEELKKSKREAEAANVLKSQLLANMSHEIRTPMNGIIGFVDLLLQTEVTVEQKLFLGHVKSASDTLMILINDILDYSKIEADKLELEYIEFNLYSLTKEVVELFSPKMQEKKLQVELSINSDVPEILLGDPTKLKQVLSNLISNAVKFTEVGGIYIQIAVVTNEQGQVKLCFTVRDTGIGMSNELIGRLFTVFTQADASTTRKYGGTGLGLAISKKIVDLMKGKIDVESKLGQGTAFYVEIEFKKGDNSKLLPVINEVARKELVESFMNNNRQKLRLIEMKQYTIPDRNENNQDKVQILLVEDTLPNQKLATIILDKLGYNVTLAENGEQAVLLCKTEKFDIILMDCQMPIMDGYQAATLIKTVENMNKNTPIIAMTANAMQGDEEKCLAAGMQDYISKPITIQKLDDIVSKWLKMRAGQ